MTNKFMFDESSHALHRVAGFAQPWELLAPGVRVRRRVVKPVKPEPIDGLAAWVAKFGEDFDGFVSEP